MRKPVFMLQLSLIEEPSGDMRLMLHGKPKSGSRKVRGT